MTLNSTKLGEVIARIRAKRKLSRPAVARAIGVTSNYLGMVEAGKRNLSALTMQKIAEVFDIPQEFITCLGSNPFPASDPRSRFNGVLLSTQNAMLSAIDAEENVKATDLAADFGSHAGRC